MNNTNIKISKTIIVKSTNPINHSNLIGLVNVNIKYNNYFLLFDNHNNSKLAFESLKKLYNDVKYGYYRIYFTISPLTNEEYTTIKTKHIEHIEKNINSSVLYYKLYRNKINNNYLGSGDLTIDSFDDLLKLIKDTTYKNYTFGTETIYSGVYYKYNKKITT